MDMNDIKYDFFLHIANMKNKNSSDHELPIVSVQIHPCLFIHSSSTEWLPLFFCKNALMIFT